MLTSFGFGQVLTLTEVTRSQLIYWTHAGLIAAGVREAHGTGHHRVFSFSDLVAVAVARALARHGMTLPSMRRVLTALTPTTPASPAGSADQLVFVMGDRTSPVSVWTGTRAEFAAELQTAFFINDPVGTLIDVGRISRALADRVGGTP